MAKKYTPNQKEYAKQQRRLRAAIRRIEKRGYEVRFNVPEMPAKVYKRDIAKISKLTVRDIYRESVYYSTDTVHPVAVPGTKQRELERREAGRKGALTRQRRLGLKDPVKAIQKYNKDLEEFARTAKEYFGDDADRLIKEYQETHFPLLPSALVDDTEYDTGDEPLYEDDTAPSTIMEKDVADYSESSVDTMYNFLVDTINNFKPVTNSYGEILNENELMLLKRMLQTMQNATPSELDDLEDRLSAERDTIDSYIEGDAFRYLSAQLTSDSNRGLQKLYTILMDSPLSLGEAQEWM